MLLGISPELVGMGAGGEKGLMLGWVRSNTFTSHLLVIPFPAGLLCQRAQHLLDSFASHLASKREAQKPTICGAISSFSCHFHGKKRRTAEQPFVVALSILEEAGCQILYFSFVPSAVACHTALVAQQLPVWAALGALFGSLKGNILRGFSKLGYF